MRTETRVRLQEVFREAEPAYDRSGAGFATEELLHGSPPTLFDGIRNRLRRVDGFDVENSPFGHILSTKDLCTVADPYLLAKASAAAWSHLRELASSIHANAVRVKATEFERELNRVLESDEGVRFRIRQGKMTGWAAKIRPVSDDGQTVLNLAAGTQLATGKLLTGRLLRGPKIPDDLQGRLEHVLAELTPRYLYREPEAHDEIYSLTFEGILASNRGERARQVLEKILKLLARKFGDDQEFANYTWGDLRSEFDLGEGDFFFVDELIRSAGLSFGGGGGQGTPEYKWGSPREIIADIYKDPGFEAFLDMRELTQVVRNVRATQAAVNGPEVEPPNLRQRAQASRSRRNPMKQDLTRIFLVHGHDEAAKQSTARFLEQLGLTPVILHEQASRGGTLAEKLEKNSNVGFAVVLLSADDVGGRKESAVKTKLKPRARQNVVLELGFFWGKLGRERVCALVADGLEKPSDYDGVAYVAMDDRGAWRMELAKELRAAGYSVDMNRVD